MGSLTYTTWTISSWLSWTNFASTWSILTWFGGAFNEFLWWITELLNVPLFLAVLFLLGIWAIFISDSSK